jgi:hypothetical protein
MVGNRIEHLRSSAGEDRRIGDSAGYQMEGPELWSTLSFFKPRVLILQQTALRIERLGRTTI